MAYPSVEKVYPSQWSGIKKKLESEGSKNKAYDSDLDGIPDNADKVDGIDLPNTIANVLTDHDKAAHDALGIDADTVDGKHASDLLDKATYDSDNDGKVEEADYASSAGDADTVDGKHASDLLDKATYDSDGDGVVEKADDADTVDGKHATSFRFRLYKGGADNYRYPPDLRVDYDNKKVVAYDGSAWQTIIGGGFGDVDTVDGKHASDLLDKSTYDSDNDGKVENADYADSAGDADTVDGKHASDFAAASHTHDAADITSGVLAEDRIPHTFDDTIRITTDPSKGGGLLLQATGATHNSPIILFVDNADTNNRARIYSNYQYLRFEHSTDGGSTWVISFSARGNGIESRHIVPEADNSYNIGGSSLRYANLYVVNLYTGDLCFEEKICPVCGQAFKKDDEIILKVKKVDDYVRTLPIHLKCSDAYRSLEERIRKLEG